MSKLTLKQKKIFDLLPGDFHEPRSVLGFHELSKKNGQPVWIVIVLETEASKVSLFWEDQKEVQWIDHHDQDKSILSFFHRPAKNIAEADLIFIFNFTLMPRDHFLMGFPAGGPYSKILDTDDTHFGGFRYNQQQQIDTIPVEWQGQTHRGAVNLPPLGCLFFEKKKKSKSVSAVKKPIKALASTKTQKKK
jgi:hypothetical protein